MPNAKCVIREREMESNILKRDTHKFMLIKLKIKQTLVKFKS